MKVSSSTGQKHPVDVGTPFGHFRVIAYTYSGSMGMNFGRLNGRRAAHYDMGARPERSLGRYLPHAIAADWAESPTTTSHPLVELRETAGGVLSEVDISNIEQSSVMAMEANQEQKRDDERHDADEVNTPCGVRNTFCQYAFSPPASGAAAATASSQGETLSRASDPAIHATRADKIVVLHVNFVSAWRHCEENSPWTTIEQMMELMAKEHDIRVEWKRLDGILSVQAIGTNAQEVQRCLEEHNRESGVHVIGVLSMDDSNRLAVTHEIEQQSNTLKPVYDKLRDGTRKLMIVCRDEASKRLGARVCSVGIQDRLENSLPRAFFDALGPGLVLSWWNTVSSKQLVEISKFMDIQRKPILYLDGGKKLNKHAKPAPNLEFCIVHNQEESAMANLVIEQLPYGGSEQASCLPITRRNTLTENLVEEKLHSMQEGTRKVAVLLEWSDQSVETFSKYHNTLTAFDVVILCFMGYSKERDRENVAAAREIFKDCEPNVHLWWWHDPNEAMKSLEVQNIPWAHEHKKKAWLRRRGEDVIEYASGIRHLMLLLVRE
eukprot:scpid69404/ scgid26761/ 